MSRRLLLVLTTGALAAGGLFMSGAARASTGASSTPSGGACHLAGNASFSPGLTASTAPFTYSFSGTLGNCQSNSGAPAGGTVEAGQPVSVNGGTYTEPLSTGSGSCSNSTTSGYSIAKWADGGVTVVKYTTTGAGAAVLLQGAVVDHVDLVPTGTTTTPATISTTEKSTPVGASSIGELTFSTASPTDVANCNTAAGLSTAVINGLIEIGQQ